MILPSGPRPARGQLSALEVDHAKRLSLWEAVFFALMVGFGETWFVACAVRLGASPLQLGLTVGLPLAVGALGPAATLVLMTRVASRRRLVCLAALLQIAALVALAASDLAGRLGPELLIVLACLYQATALGGGTAWSSWFGDLVPQEGRGAYFARRNRRVQLAVLASVLVAGGALEGLQGGPVVAADQAGWGFRVVFLAAALFRCVSVALLLRSPEPLFRGLSTPRRTARFLRTDRGRGAGRMLAFGAAFQLVTYLASPYFTPFMLEELRFSYLELTLATITVIAAKILLLAQWGKAIDAHGARQVFVLCAMLAALVPVPWVFSGGLGLALVAQALSGSSWAGYELSYFSVLLGSTFRRTRPQTFAAQNALNGLAQLAGSLGGVLLLGVLGGDLRAVFAVSAVTRLGLALGATRWLPQPQPEVIGRRALLLRVVGFRAHGGLVHRVDLDAGGDPGDPDPSDQDPSGADPGDENGAATGARPAAE